MSAASSKTTDVNKSEKPAQKEADQQPQPQAPLGALEEDDEFEEFPSQDWDDSDTNLAHLNGNGAAVSADKLWEDNWDDDDIEDEFSVQLRNELAKTGKNPAGGAASGGTSASGGGDAMQH